MQSQLFKFDNDSYVNRSTERHQQEFARIARLEAQLVKTQRELATVKAARNELIDLNARFKNRIEEQADRINALLALVKQLQQPSSPAWGNMPLEIWRRLVQLCHPDRHGGSDAANKATQWLNSVRPTE